MAVGNAQDPVDGDGPVRWRPGSGPYGGGLARFAGVGALVLGLLLGVVSFDSFVHRIPGAVSWNADYRAAEPCPVTAGARSAAETADINDADTAGPEGCLRAVAFTVAGIVVDRTPRSRRYQASLNSPVLRPTVSFADPGPLLERLRPGDRVAGTLWRGRVVALATDEARQATLDEPRDETRTSTGIATGLGLLAILSLRFGLRWFRSRPDHHLPHRPHHDRHAHPFDHRPAALVRTAVLTGLAVFLGCLALGAVAQVLELSRWIVPALAVPATLLPVRLAGRIRREPGAGPGSPVPTGF
ncbi:hypothetical protein ABZ990_26485 [Streptomyces sp. NPDC046203]|uniref:hypothetical protein n=1 Tax=Streptomyces sp. NPDC046203 TaxID=3154602 RepID=UPI00340F9E16